MLHMPAHLQSGNRNLPRRVDSLANSKGPFFTELEEELLDIKRVNTHGQEEDLKMALSRMICRVEELVRPSPRSAHLPVVLTVTSQ